MDEFDQMMDSPEVVEENEAQLLDFIPLNGYKNEYEDSTGQKFLASCPGVLKYSVQTGEKNVDGLTFPVFEVFYLPAEFRDGNLVPAGNYDDNIYVETYS